jgi:hypothetical protein
MLLSFDDVRPHHAEIKRLIKEKVLPKNDFDVWALYIAWKRWVPWIDENVTGEWHPSFETFGAFSKEYQKNDLLFRVRFWFERGEDAALFKLFHG